MTALGRAPGVVWRLAGDRVLVRRVGVRGDDAALDLLGAAALVWVALDEPRPPADVAAEIAAVGRDLEPGELAGAVLDLRDRGLVVEITG